MEAEQIRLLSDFIQNDIRMKTLPTGVSFLKDRSKLPEKTRQPSKTLHKRITICQAVTIARTYGWQVGICKEDTHCVPASIAFGFTDADEPETELSNLFCEVNFNENEAAARETTGKMQFLKKNEYEAILLSPLSKMAALPDIALFYGNPAQVMRLVQAWLYTNGDNVESAFFGKVECSEYLITPFRTGTPRLSIPGAGDRIFSMTQDDEMIFILPGDKLETVADGLKEAGKKIGLRYPVTFYQNFEAEFPAPHQQLGKKWGIL